MAEEVTEQAQNEVVEPETTTTPSPEVETETAAPTETEDQAPEQAAQVEETVVEPERKPNRAERRIKELNNQVKQLQQQSQLPQAPGTPPTPQFDLMQFADSDGNIDIAAANAAANNVSVQAAQSIADLTVQQRLAQHDAQRNVQEDTKSLPLQYSRLNPDSPDYSPEIEQAITEEFQEKAFRIAGYDRSGQPIYALDPSVRLSTVAERYMKVADVAATKSQASMKNAVAQTADTAAIKPSGESGKSDKPFEELSIAEMEAKLGPSVRR